jgi:hypothetical protein
MTDDGKSEKEFHVDEDWKQSVQEEKERMRAREQGGREAGRQAAGQMPEPSVQMLVADFYQQALIALGVIENPITNEKTRVPQVASYLIDLIALLEKKMAGNLEPQEEKYIGNVLHDLRMRYVNCGSESADQAGRSTPETGADTGPETDQE